MEHSCIKLVIADDHPMVLHGLMSFLTAEPDFRVVAASKDGASALDDIRKHRPDIALLDLRLPEMTGLEILHKVSNERLATRVIILTTFIEDHDVLAVSRGVQGVIMKDSVVDDLIQIVRKVYAGIRCVPPQLVKREPEVNQTGLTGTTLTSREWEVIFLVAEGISNKAVAERLKISEGTVKLHVHHIYCKTGASSRSALIRLA